MRFRYFDLRHLVVHCLSWLLLYTWYVTQRDTARLLIGLQLSSSACIVYSDVLWSFHIGMEGTLTQTEQDYWRAFLFRSVEQCSNNSRLPCVERWCTLDENSDKLRCLEFCSGVSHSCCNLYTHALSSVGPKLTWLICCDCALHFQQ
jgi:hypothetical protein